MVLTAVFIGVAAVSGAAGIGTTVKAAVDSSHAHSINDEANLKIRNAAERLDFLRKKCGDSLEKIGEEKLFVLNNSINEFITHFQKIKNVDFSEAEGILEINNLHVDKNDFEELAEMSKLSLTLVEGGISGVAGGTLAAVGAYGAASTFATASTGTAIASLSGAAASNATLAFFGGGSIAAGGLGVAGGTAVLGGLVAGPALLVMGIISSAKAGKTLQDAYANNAKADEICAELDVASVECIAIRRRCYMFYSLLAKLDSYLYSLNQEMKKIIKTEGVDYSKYSDKSKKTIAAIVSNVASIKAVLDTTILTEDGKLTPESEICLKNTISE